MGGGGGEGGGQLLCLAGAVQLRGWPGCVPGGCAGDEHGLASPSSDTSGRNILLFCNCMLSFGLFRGVNALSSPSVEATPTPTRCLCWSCPHPSCWASASQRGSWC